MTCGHHGWNVWEDREDKFWIGHRLGSVRVASDRGGQLGSRRTTWIKPADSDRPGGLLGSRLDRVEPADSNLAALTRTRPVGLIEWLERSEGEEARIHMHADWVGQGCSMRSSAEGLKTNPCTQGAQADEPPLF
jgi:hypothetical protein